MGFKPIKEFSIKYHNTGGGEVSSQSFLERAIKNKSLIVDFCKRNHFKPTNILEIGFGKGENLIFQSRTKKNDIFFAIDPFISGGLNLKKEIQMIF